MANYQDKGDQFHGRSYHHNHQGSFKKNPINKDVWVRAVPSWEKDFCYKIGSFTWKRFVEAKKHGKYDWRIMEWDDLAGKEAFLAAKEKFYSQMKGLKELDHSTLSPDPDMYNDEINWDEDEQVNHPELYKELDLATSANELMEESEYVPDEFDYKLTEYECVPGTSSDGVWTQPPDFRLFQDKTGLILTCYEQT